MNCGIWDKRVVAVSLAAAIAAGVGAGARAAQVNVGAKSVRLGTAAIPRFKVPGYPTLIVTGSYPVVIDRPDAGSTNRAIRRAVLAEELRFKEFLNRWKRTIPAENRRSLHGGMGLSVNRNLISASTIVVSGLLPLEECLPGGTGCNRWLSVTVDVRNAELVRLRQLFTRPVAALTAIATVARHQLMRNRCVGRYVNLEAVRSIWTNYLSWALVPAGLVIGFDTGHAATPYCGPLRTVVPYSVIRPKLNTLGRTLIAGVRRPS